MWRVAIMIAACGGAGAAPVQPAPVPVAKPDETGVPAIQMLARVGYRKSTGWTDIAIEGTGEDALRWCNALVERHQHRKVGPLEAVILRPCEPTQLPRGPSGFALVDRDDLDVLELAVIGVPDPDRIPTGTTTHIAWFDTATACERWRQVVVSQARANQAEVSLHATEFLTRQLVDAKLRATAACKQPTCDAKDPRCKTTIDDVARECRQANERVATIEARARNQPFDEPPATPPCVQLSGGDTGRSAVR